MTFADIIRILSIGSVVPPLIIATVQWKSLSKELQPLRWILIVSFFSEVLLFIASRLFGNTYPVGNTFLLIQFLIILYMYSAYQKNPRTLVYIGVGYLVFFIINALYIESFLQLITIPNVLASLILIFLTLKYLYKLLNDLSVTYVHRLPMLWFTFAVLLYYGCTLFIFLANNFLLRNLIDSQGDMWTVHNFFNITKNILFAVALWRDHRLTKSSTSL